MTGGFSLLLVRMLLPSIPLKQRRMFLLLCWRGLELLGPRWLKLLLILVGLSAAGWAQSWQGAFEVRVVALGRSNLGKSRSSLTDPIRWRGLVRVVWLALFWAEILCSSYGLRPYPSLVGVFYLSLVRGRAEGKENFER